MDEIINLDDGCNDGDFIDLLPYYVYELRDPRTNEVFYVGKGSKDRIDAHSAEEENAKAERIQEIKNSGHVELRIIIGRFQTEDEAFAVEAVSIKWTYGFSNLTNLVHGHHHRFVRPFDQKACAAYTAIPGIDRRRKIGVQRDGGYTGNQRQQISENQVLEKLESLRDALRLRTEFHNYSVSDPDLSVPQDPCILVTGLPSPFVQIQIKMQLSGATVVLNLVPSDRRRLAEFQSTLTAIEFPFAIKKGGNSRFGGLYTQTHDFKSSQGGYPRGIPQNDVESIVRMSEEAVSRLGVRPVVPAADR